MTDLPLCKTLLDAPDYRATWQPIPPGGARLDFNEAASDVDPGLKHAILERLAACEWNRYPDPHAAGVRHAAAKAYGVDASAIVVGNGSNSLIGLVVGAIDPAATVIVCRPDFPVHDRALAIHGIRTVNVPLQPWDAPQPFALDRSGIAAAVAAAEKPAVILANPGNPTGALHDDAFLLDLAQSVAARGGLLVIDEAYAEFAGRSLVTETVHRPSLVVLRTLSKAYGIAGLRLGMAIGHPETARVLARAQLPYEVGLAAQVAGEMALLHGTLSAALVAGTVARRQALSARLQALPGLAVLPSAANFVLVRVHAGPQRALAQLQADGLLVRDVGTLPGLGNCLRVTIGTAAENERVVAAFTRAAAS
jgi:histidinol-phosphate aminotransferase